MIANFLLGSMGHAEAPKDYSVVQRQAQKMSFQNIAPHHKGERFDENIYIGSVSHGEFHSTITLLAMHQKQDEWLTSWHYTFPHPEDTHVPATESSLMPCNVMSGEEDFTRPKIFLKVDDVDGDGQPEVLLRTITCHIYRAIGEKTKREMYIFNVQPTGLQLATHILLDEDTASWNTKSTIQFEDVNADGHRDILRKSTTEDFAGKKHKKEIFLYDPTKDLYTHQK